MEWNTRRPPLPRRDERDEQIDTRARSHALDFVVALLKGQVCEVRGEQEGPALKQVVNFR